MRKRQTEHSEPTAFDRILLLAPLGRTAEATARTLARADLACVLCANNTDLRTALTPDAGALLLIEEALTTETVPILSQFLMAQPAWSDLPIVLFTREEPTQPGYAAALAQLGTRRNVTVLQRPVPAGTLISVVQTALADRQRQVEVRDLLRAEQQTQQSLRASQAQLRAVFDTVDVGIAVQGDEGALLMMNPMALRMNGLDPSRDMPGNFSSTAELREHYQVYTLEGDAVPFEEWPATKAQRGEPFRNYEIEIHCLATGHRWIGRFSGNPVAGQPGERALFVTSMQDVTTQKQTASALHELMQTLEQRVEERTEQIRRLTLTLAQAEQQERRRISQFLHDDLQQILYGLQIRLQMLGEDLPLDEAPDLRESFDTLGEMLEEAILRTRTLTVDLSPPVLKDENLGAALVWLAEKMHQLHNLRGDTSQVADVQVADENERTLLFQIVREILFNVVKHAGVTEARITLSGQNGGCRICVEDDGVGFDPSQRPPPQDAEGGFGFHSIAERIAVLGGQLDIDSAPGQGTRVTLYVPRQGGPQLSSTMS